MARDASTYRGMRRNRCIREDHAPWGPHWYYRGHDYESLHKRGHYKHHTEIRTRDRSHPLAEVRGFLAERAAGKIARAARDWWKTIGKMGAGAPRARSAGRGT